MKVVLKYLFVVAAMETQVFADANAMKEALPPPPDGYKSEIEEETAAHQEGIAWLGADEATKYKVEIKI